MTLTAQFALYPLRAARLTPVLTQALAAARATGVTVESGPMSSALAGTGEQVFAALQSAFAAAAASGDVVLVATVSNACPATDQ
jgi:uncharacterized protein YqgV (UPF0045/DUF77 family)